MNRPFIRPAFVSGFGLYGYPTAYYYGSDSCYSWQQVPTRTGWRWQRTWVCGTGYF